MKMVLRLFLATILLIMACGRPSSDEKNSSLQSSSDSPQLAEDPYPFVWTPEMKQKLNNLPQAEAELRRIFYPMSHLINVAPKLALHHAKELPTRGNEKKAAEVVRRAEAEISSLLKEVSKERNFEDLELQLIGSLAREAMNWSPVKKINESGVLIMLRLNPQYASIAVDQIAEFSHMQKERLKRGSEANEYEVLGENVLAVGLKEIQANPVRFRTILKDLIQKELKSRQENPKLVGTREVELQEFLSNLEDRKP